MVQYVLELGQAEYSAKVMNQLFGHYPELSVQKFSSNVVEKCLKLGGHELSEIREKVIPLNLLPVFWRSGVYRPGRCSRSIRITFYIPIYLHHHSLAPVNARVSLRIPSSGMHAYVSTASTLYPLLTGPVPQPHIL